MIGLQHLLQILADQHKVRYEIGKQNNCEDGVLENNTPSLGQSSVHQFQLPLPDTFRFLIHDLLLGFLFAYLTHSRELLILRWYTAPAGVASHLGV